MSDPVAGIPDGLAADGAALDDLVAAFAATLPFVLDPFQVEAIRKLETHAGLLVSAPTSSGKTVVAEYAIWRCVAAPPSLRLSQWSPHRVIYTTPLKALSNQKYRDLRERHGDAAVGLVTGEHSVNDTAPVVVMTTEILRNILYDEPERLALVRDVVLDEVHYIDDHPRGTVWEEVIIEAPQHIRLLGLSATISNVDEVAEWMSGLRGGDVAVVLRTQRPVELRMWLSIGNQLHPLFDDQGRVARRTVELAQNERVHEAGMRWASRTPDNDLLRVVGELARRSMLPAIYFIFSRRGCREALQRCAVHGLDLTNAEEKARIEAAWEERLRLVDDPDEREVYRQALGVELLRRGLAMHHAGLLPYAKETVEQLFQAGLIKVVFATETLSLGLNMPARACVISSFTKFDGTGFSALSSGALTQLMGRAGRRGIDTLGHGIVLKEFDVDIGDIYEAASGSEMSVISKFAPTYTMTLSLLRTRSVEQAEALLQKSFGQFQYQHNADHWGERQENLRGRLTDLRAMVFQHPRVRCTERTLTQFLRETQQVSELDLQIRKLKREHWRDSRRGRFGAGHVDPRGRLEATRRSFHAAEQKLQRSPCRACPLLAEHRANRTEVDGLEDTLRHGEEELHQAKQRYRREFHALRAVLHAGGYLENDRVTPLGVLASALYGESALLVARAVQAGWLEGMGPAEIAATLVMLANEDRGRERRGRPEFPTARVELAYRHLRGTLQHLGALEASHGIQTLRALSVDYVGAAYAWVQGTSLSELEAEQRTDLGDIVKAVKNLYSLLRQLEQALHGDPLQSAVRAARERTERDLIRRV